MAVNPALGMDRVADGVACPAYGITVGLQIGDEWFYFIFIRDQELDIVPAGKAQITVTVFIGNLTDIPDPIGTDQARRADPDCIEFVARLSHVFQQAGFKAFVVLPLTVVLFDDGWEHLPKVRRAKICF